MTIKARRFASRSSIRQTNSLNSNKRSTQSRAKLGVDNRKMQMKPEFFSKEKPKPNTLVFDLGFTWRREWDSNPWYAYGVHTISNRAPSASRTSLHLCYAYFKRAYYTLFFLSLQQYYSIYFIFSPLSSRKP